MWTGDCIVMNRQEISMLDTSSAAKTVQSSQRWDGTGGFWEERTVTVVDLDGLVCTEVD